LQLPEKKPAPRGPKQTLGALFRDLADTNWTKLVWWGGEVVSCQTV
jgi:hypothetical protein